jgi:hypothetical protein
MTAFVLVAQPEDRRTALVQQALARFAQPPAQVLAYEALLGGRADLREALAPNSVLRFDSPGESFAVEKALLAAGAAEAEAEGAPFLPLERLVETTFDHGRVLFPRQWYLGFRRSLREWGRVASAVPGVRLPVVPADVEVMFDKRLCHAACQAAGVAVPEALGPVGSYDELLARLDEAGWQRAFRRNGPGQEALTSAELVRVRGEVRLYNSLRLRRYVQVEDVRAVIDVLAREGAHVERWLPKASLSSGTTFDLRVVVIAGEARQVVVREGRGPMTNLHLGNRRGNVEALLARLGEEGWEAVRATCRRAAALFPNSLCIGIDVALAPDFRQHAVLEMNAFGDLLPGVLWRGLDTYSTQVAALLGREL